MPITQEIYHHAKIRELLYQIIQPRKFSQPAVDFSNTTFENFMKNAKKECLVLIMPKIKQNV